MKLPKVIRWELLHVVRGKQFLLMTILIPAIVAVAVFAVTLAFGADEGPSRTLSEPPPPAIIAVFLAVILFMGAFLSGVMTLYSVVKEKQSRVVEMVLSSISAREMMGGKVIGLGIAGLLQVTIWAATAFFVAGRFIPLSLSSLSLVHWITFPLYFILGFLLIASLYASLGAVMKDIQSGGASGLIGMIPYAPILFASFIIQNPGNLVVRIVGFLPPFAPAVMMLRISATPMMSDGAQFVPGWEIALSLLSLILGVVVTMRFAARVFEVGMLMYGKSATFQELWRWGRTGRS